MVVCCPHVASSSMAEVESQGRGGTAAPPSFQSLLTSLRGQLDSLRDAVSRLELEHQREVREAIQVTGTTAGWEQERQALLCENRLLRSGAGSRQQSPRTRGGSSGPSARSCGPSSRSRGGSGSKAAPPRVGLDPHGAACCGGLVALMAKAVAGVEAEGLAAVTGGPARSPRARSASCSRISTRKVSVQTDELPGLLLTPAQPSTGSKDLPVCPHNSKELVQQVLDPSLVVALPPEDPGKFTAASPQPWPSCSPSASVPLTKRDRDSSFGQLWPLWVGEEAARKVGKDKHHAYVSELARNILDHHLALEAERAKPVVQEERTLEACLEPFIVSPGSWGNFFWEAIGGAHIAWDMMMIPMTAFDMPQALITTIVDWTTVAYWSMDVFYQFLVSYEIHGVVERNPRKVALHYFKTWFGPDICVVLMDWFILITGMYAGASRSWRAGKLVKAFRILRAVRLIRVVKFVKMLMNAMDKATTIRMVVYLKAAYMALTLFMISHYMGCYWYMMSTIVSSSWTTWVTYYELEGAPVSTLYLHSLYWSVSQSGCGGVNMFPTNAVERIFASIANIAWNLLILLCLACSTVWALQLRDSFLPQEKMEAGIRAYLTEKSVSSTVRIDVLRYFRLNWTKWSRKTHAMDVQFFTNLPVFLKVELYKQVYAPLLTHHPMLAQLPGHLMDPLCLLAVTEKHYLTEKRLFNKGDEAKEMIFVRNGELSYYLDISRPITLCEGEWICEAALWLRWRHLGWLVSKTSCDLVEIDVPRFLAVMSEASRQGIDLSSVRRYARLITQHFGEEAPQSDCWNDLDAISSTVDTGDY